MQDDETKIFTSIPDYVQYKVDLIIDLISRKLKIIDERFNKIETDIDYIKKYIGNNED